MGSVSPGSGGVGGTIANLGQDFNQGSKQFGQGNIGGAFQDWTGNGYSDLLGQGANGRNFANGVFGNADGSNQPTPPKTPSSLAGLQAQQQQYAQQFSQNLPQMQQKMAGLLTQQANQQMSGQIAQVKNQNNRRGMEYGGVNQGQQGQVRAADQQNLGQAITGSNANLENASNTLNAQAVETGVGIQQTNQAIQNQIFQQQMAQMNSQNSVMGSALGTGLMSYMAFA